MIESMPNVNLYIKKVLREVRHDEDDLYITKKIISIVCDRILEKSCGDKSPDKIELARGYFEKLALMCIAELSDEYCLVIFGYRNDRNRALVKAKFSERRVSVREKYLVLDYVQYSTVVYFLSLYLLFFKL